MKIFSLSVKRNSPNIYLSKKTFRTEGVTANIFFRSLIDFEMPTHKGRCTFISKLVYWTINSNLNIPILPREVQKKSWFCLQNTEIRRIFLFNAVWSYDFKA
jgi:hypothetical protein